MAVPPFALPTGTTMVFGIPGTGKSALIREWVAPEPRVIFVDPFPPPGVTHVMRGAGVPPIVFDPQAGAWIQSPTLFNSSIPEFRIHWQAPPDWEYFQSLNNVTFVFDDSAKHWKVSEIRYTEDGNDYQSALLTRGRKLGQKLIFATQYPHYLAPEVRDLAICVVIFALTGRLSRKAVMDSWEIDAPWERYKYHWWRL